MGNQKRMKKFLTGLFFAALFFVTALLHVEAANATMKNGTEVQCVKLLASGLKPAKEGMTAADCAPAEVKAAPGQEGMYDIVKAYWTTFRPDVNGGSGYASAKEFSGTFGATKNADGTPVYLFVVELWMKDEYQFPERFSQLGAMKFGEALTINGLPVEFGQRYNLRGVWIFTGRRVGERGKIHAFFEVREQALTPIGRIDLKETGFAMPVTGQTAASAPQPLIAPVAAQNGMYDITDAYWVEGEGPATPFTGTFAEGKKYYYYIKLKAREGYYFSENIKTEYADPWYVYMNGDQVGADESRYYWKTCDLECMASTYSARLYLNESVTPPAPAPDTGKWEQDNKGWRYRRADGSLVKGEWCRVGDKQYHFDADGYMQKGWLKLAAWYYLDGSGAMVTGWKKISGKWYYFDRFGAMQTGWVKTGGKYYYLGSDGAMKTGWYKQGSTWYYLKPDGSMVTGWQQIGGKWYYFNSRGVMQTGWIKSGGKWYYLDASGAMLANTTGTIGGKTYRFDASGICTNP